jgi:predicted MPP superfamily phosphohydrolase
MNFHKICGRRIIYAKGVGMKKITARHIAAAAVAALPVALFTVAGFSLRLNTADYELESEKIDKPLRIVFLSDLHDAEFGERQEQLINAVKFVAPDFIVYGGDILVDDMPNTRSVFLLSGLKGLCPAFAVAGNHEVKTGNLSCCKAQFAYYGVQMLEGNCIITEINGQPLEIGGLEDYYIGKKEFSRQIRYFQKYEPENYSILISHRPELKTQYEKMRFDLILSGHAHGGQWRIPGILNGFYAPGQGFFPNRAGGLYSIGKANHIVGRGLSKIHMGFRFYNPPEIVVIDIVPKL